MNQRMTFRRGVTLIELLIALLIISVVMTGIFNLLDASWRAYDNIVWQNTLNNEARRALDDICDTVRSSGHDRDWTTAEARRANLRYDASLNAGTTYSSLSVKPRYTNGDILNYDINNGRLTRNAGSGNRMVAQYITNIHFDYEYRDVSQADARWSFSRADSPDKNTDIYYTTRTIYITVTASHQPYPNGPTYSRTLRSAITLRMPYNLPIPFSQPNGS